MIINPVATQLVEPPPFVFFLIEEEKESPPKSSKRKKKGAQFWQIQICYHLKYQDLRKQSYGIYRNLKVLVATENYGFC